jgi:serine/threonine protein kinase
MSTDPPVAIGRYRLIRSLGTGSRGDLYLAFDPALEREVAVRVLPPMPADIRHRVARALRSHAALRQSGLAPIFDVGDYDGRLFLTRAFVAGRSVELVAWSGCNRCATPWPPCIGVGSSASD